MLPASTGRSAFTAVGKGSWPQHRCTHSRMCAQPTWRPAAWPSQNSPPPWPQPHASGHRSPAARRAHQKQQKRPCRRSVAGLQEGGRVGWGKAAAAVWGLRAGLPHVESCAVGSAAGAAAATSTRCSRVGRGGGLGWPGSHPNSSCGPQHSLRPASPAAAAGSAKRRAESGQATHHGGRGRGRRR